MYLCCRWRGRSWLEEVLTDQNDVDWSFITMFDLRPRPDNGAINTSPRAAVGTLFRAQQGCEQSLVLPSKLVNRLNVVGI